MAIRAIGRIAPDTKSAGTAVTALNEALDPQLTMRFDIRFAAIEILPSFGAEAERTLPRLRAWQDGPQDFLEKSANRAIKAIEGPGSEKRDEGGSR